ncbi:MAG: RNA-binding S4 domain-containing protein, partial [Bacteroidales bacterium]|nr:RNA-binding S4 domain-containing protein [Bacteroidales bacterium]
MEEVRIDKYLWSIRVYKTRSEAADACKGGKIRLNGNDVKPARTVRPGDVVTARKGAVTYTYKVLELIDKRQGAALVPRYAENLTAEEEIGKLRAPVET